MLAALVTALVAAAPPAIAVAPIQGKGAKPCTKVIREIAGEHGALEPWVTKLRESPPPTWGEMAKWMEDRKNELRADVIVFGTVAGSRLVLEAYDPGRSKLIGLRRVTTAKRCKLGAASREVIDLWFRELVAYTSGEAPPKSSVALLDAEGNGAGDEHPVEIEDHARGADLLGGHRESPPREQPAPPVDLRPQARPQPRAPAVPRARAVAVELGIAVVNRSFALQGALTPNLRAFDAAAMPAPRVTIEASPFAGLVPRLAPLFVTARYHRAVGVEASRPEGGPDHDATYFDLAAGAGYRIDAFGATFSPYVGYHRTQFLLDVAGGVREPDLPAVAYGSLELGIRAEAPLRDRVRIFGSASYLVVLSGGEVFTRAYFANGSAIGLDLEAGGSLELSPGLSVVLAAGYMHYSLSLGSSEVRVASSATDASFAMRTGLRLEL